MPQTQGKNGLNCPLSAAAQLMAAAQGSLKIDLVALNNALKPLLSLLPLLLQISNFLLVFILFFALEWLLTFYHLYKVGACGKPVFT